MTILASGKKTTDEKKILKVTLNELHRFKIFGKSMDGILHLLDSFTGGNASAGNIMG